ncbi:MAG: redoxin domain-containing protein [Ignavibacteriae bacterium]|nr:redoxin domain-containing protein [Ignavibacteriota bacterium]
MDTLNIGLLTALIAGVISFASPCVLPIVPGYLSFITGLGLHDLTDQEKRKTVLRTAAINSILFVIGFSIIFILLGASATAVGTFLRENLDIIGKVAGVVILFFGLHMVGLIKIPFLLYEKRIQAESKSLGVGRSFIAGIFFAFGWTPCIGPILAGILAIAAVQETAARGIALLGVYSLGLGIPFIFSAVFLNAFFTTFAKVKHHLHKVEVAGGVVLIAIGLLIFTGKLAAISQRFDFMNPEYLLQQESVESTKQDDALTLRQDNNGFSSTQRDTASADIGNVAANFGKYEFTLKTLDGRTIRLSDYAGKVVLVNIWAPWCGPCRMETPGFVKLYEQYKVQGFEILSVAVETNEKDVKAFIKKYGVRWSVGMDDEIARAYGTYGLPDNFLFGPDGKVIKHFVGFTQEETLKPLIEQAL